jgi:hypothetical protein
VAAAGLIAAGCGAQKPKTPAPPAVANASRVNMCTILTGAELTGLGVRLDTRKHFNNTGVVGCRWLGKPFTLSLERDNDTLTGYQAHRNDPKFVNFTDNTVNGRAGAHFGVDRSGAQCAQLIDGGSVSLSVSVAVPSNLNPPPADPCAEALRIAQMIEPRLPKTPK